MYVSKVIETDTFLTISFCCYVVASQTDHINLAVTQLLILESGYVSRPVGRNFKMGWHQNLMSFVPFFPKSWGGTTILFTLFPSKVGVARATPATPLTTGLLPNNFCMIEQD